MDNAVPPSFAFFAKGGIPWMSVPPAAAVTDLYQQGLYQGTTSVVRIKSNKIAGRQPLPPNGEQQNARRIATRDLMCLWHTTGHENRGIPQHADVETWHCHVSLREQSVSPGQRRICFYPAPQQGAQSPKTETWQCHVSTPVVPALASVLGRERMLAQHRHSPAHAGRLGIARRFNGGEAEDNPWSPASRDDWPNAGFQSRHMAQHEKLTLNSLQPRQGRKNIAQSVPVRCAFRAADRLRAG